MGGGSVVELGHGIAVTLPSGWEVINTPEPGVAVVSDGIAYITLQTFRAEGSTADVVMSSYVEQMKETFQNPTLSGPEPRDVGPDGTASVMVIEGTRTGSNGSYSALLGSTIAVRNADGVGVLSSMLVEPQDWDASLDAYNGITGDLVTELLG